MVLHYCLPSRPDIVGPAEELQLGTRTALTGFWSMCVMLWQKFYKKCNVRRWDLVGRGG